ncbi:flagellar biosynthesis regulator FlaF [Rubellimicrobium aerolatum]|uniref:Flagellar biosynthesis regulator FlaF n=1 Tax=Rubellimicrobium aerolatum TaxID=490979 RepID=A0ABW0S9V3_9RHOB|nr:flagellar protein FlaF [Rubellimicrobium aerolatum]
MNAIERAHQAYAGAAAPIMTDRRAEHQVFSTVTARLHAAAKADPAELGAFPRLAAALHDNRRLWTRLAVDVADSDNGLPAELRARIVYLAKFTLHHSSRVLRGEAEPQALIDINTAVMRGLAGTPAAPAQVPQ